jgi:Ca-activated chloride channel family protein
VTPDHQGVRELGRLKVRYKRRDGDQSHLLSWPVRDGDGTLATMSSDFRFSAAVAALGLALQASPHRGAERAAMARELAASALGAGDADDPHKQEFLTLASKAQSLARGTD